MRVPRLIPQATIENPPIPRAAAPGPEAFGGTIASTLSKSGLQLEYSAKRMQQEIDAIKGLNLTVKAQQRISDILYGENGLGLRQGLEAEGASKEFNEQYFKIIEEISAEAENNNQRNVFAQSMLRRLPAYQSQLSQYEAAEIQKAKVQQLNASLTLLTEEAIASKGNPEAMTAFTQEAELIITALGGKYGKEFVTSLMNKWNDDVHSGVVLNFLANDELDAAKSYYEKNKDKIGPDNQTKIEGFLTDKEQTIFIQETAYDIAQRFKGKEEDALKHIRENYSGETEDKLAARVQGIFADERRFEADRYDKYLNSVLTRVSATGSFAESLKIIEESNLKAADKLSLRRQVTSEYRGSDVGMWDSVKAFEEIRWRASLPDGNPYAFRSEAELVASFAGRLTKEQQRTIYQVWRTRNAHPELYDSIYKAVKDNNIPEALLPSFAGDVYDAIEKKEVAEKRSLSNPEIESTIREVLQSKRNIYLSANYGRNIPPEIDQWLKRELFPNFREDPRAFLEFQEVYLEFIDTMVGATGQASIKPSTYYALAEALFKDVVVSQGFFRKNRLKGFEIYRMGGILKEAPDGSLQWYMDRDGEWVPAWEVLGGMPIDRRKR